MELDTINQDSNVKQYHHHSAIPFDMSDPSGSSQNNALFPSKIWPGVKGQPENSGVNCDNRDEIIVVAPHTHWETEALLIATLQRVLVWRDTFKRRSLWKGEGCFTQAPPRKETNW